MPPTVEVTKEITPGSASQGTPSAAVTSGYIPPNNSLEPTPGLAVSTSYPISTNCMTCTGSLTSQTPTLLGSPTASKTLPVSGTPTPINTPTFIATFTPQATQTSAIIPAIVKTERLDVWDDPANDKSYWHRQTQLITGEEVLVLQQKDGWAQIIASQQPSHKNSQGYPGWVRADGLKLNPDLNGQVMVVAVRTVHALVEPKTGAASLMRLYIDTHLPLVSRSGAWDEVQLPDGRNAWLADSEVRPLSNPPTFSYASFFETARSLAGAPYLWGGTTADSPDCSGFIYRLFHAFGITLPRDADDQALAGQAVSFDLKTAGDLIFYQDSKTGPITHVGLYMGNNEIMDANPMLGLSIHPVSDMLKWYYFSTVRRILSTR